MSRKLLSSLTLASFLFVSGAMAHNQDTYKQIDSKLDQIREEVINLIDDKKEIMNQPVMKSTNIEKDQVFSDRLQSKLDNDKDYLYVTELYKMLKTEKNLDFVLDRDTKYNITTKVNELSRRYRTNDVYKIVDFFDKEYEKHKEYKQKDIHKEIVVKHNDPTKGVSLREHPMMEYSPNQIIFMNNGTFLDLHYVFKNTKGDYWGKVTIKDTKDELTGWVNLRYTKKVGKF